MREICLDTETTGLEPKDGHRIIEIGCVELINKIKTGKVFQCYINPQRAMPEEAFKIHGLSTEFLNDKPIFSSIVDEFLNFIQDSKLVIHNANFDMKFINHELRNCGKEIIERVFVTDSLEIARSKFPGSPNSLDALCKRFNIDNKKRIKHGALMDADLLADIYLELMGGNQVSMFENNSHITNSVNSILINDEKTDLKIPKSRNFRPSDEEIKLHQEFISKNFKNNLWGY
jgi:DNA polymerase-3 subunit epsilon